MKITIITFTLFALAGGATSVTASAQTLPQQLSLEKWFVGNWICEGTHHASPT